MQEEGYDMPKPFDPSVTYDTTEKSLYSVSRKQMIAYGQCTIDAFESKLGMTIGAVHDHCMEKVAIETMRGGFDDVMPIRKDDEIESAWDLTPVEWKVLIAALADSALRYEVEAEDYQSKSDAAMDTLRDIEVLKRKLERM